MENYSNIKKEIELFWVQLFQKESDFTFKIIEATESPDFIIRCLSQDIGLEVINIYKDNTESKESQLKEKEIFQYTILNTAKEKYISKSYRPIRLYVLFSPDFNTKKINQTQVSQILFEFLSKLNIEEWKNMRYSRSSANWGNMSQYFSSISVVGLPIQHENYWTPIDFGFVSPVTEGLILKQIEKKEKNY